MKIIVKSGAKKVKHVDRFGAIGDRSIPIVEVWIDGYLLVHECDSIEQARAMVITLSYALGVE